MALTDIVSKVLTVMTVDTSDMKRGLKELSGEQKKMAEAELAQADARNQQYNGWKKSLTEVNSALEIVGKVVNVAKESFRAYADDLRIRSAAGAVSIDKLKAASLGLRTEHELMTFAAQTQRGVIKANEDQMATAQAAMVGLTRAGFDQSEVTKKVTDAMISLKVNGLDDLGITVKKGATDVETYSNLMAELGKHAKGVEGGTLSASEGVDKMGVTMQESMDKMKQALGQLVAAMAPLLNALAKAVGIVADLAKGHMDVSAAGGAVNFVLDQQMKEQGKVRDPERPGMYIDEGSLRARRAIRGFAGQGNFDAGVYQGFAGYGNFGATSADQSTKAAAGFGAFKDIGLDSFLVESLSSTAEHYAGVVKDELEKLKKDPKVKKSNVSDAELLELAIAEARRALAPYYAAAAAKEAAEKSRAGIQAQGYGDWRVGSMGTLTSQDWMGGVNGFDFQAQLDKDAATAKARDHMADGYEDFRKRTSPDAMDYMGLRVGDKQSFLESTFGKLEDFNAYGAAFGLLTGSVTSAMDAWITGSMSAGQAVKKFIGDALKGLASQMAIESLKHGAYAIGSLAYGDFRGAATHGAAAAAFGGAAVAAAVAAKAMGGGGAAAASGGSASASGGGASASGGSGGSGGSDGDAKPAKETIIVAYLDPFANQPEHMRRQQAEEMVRNVMGGGVVENS